MHVLYAHIFPLCFDDEPGYVHINAALKTFRYFMLINGDSQHQTGISMVSSCRTRWLHFIQVEGCWAFVMVELQALVFFKLLLWLFSQSFKKEKTTKQHFIIGMLVISFHQLTWRETFSGFSWKHELFSNLFPEHARHISIKVLISRMW